MSQQNTPVPVTPQGPVAGTPGLPAGGGSPINGAATASLVLGIISLFASLLFAPAVVGLILGVVGLVRSGRTTPPVGRGKAIAGIVMAAIGFVFGAMLINALTSGDTTADGAGTSITQEADTGGGDDAPADAEPAETAEGEPVEEAKADPFDEQYGAFKTVKESGTGKSVVKLPEGVSAAMVSADHTGASNFALTALDASNQPTGDLLVNTIGNYSGTTAYGLNGIGEATSLQIEADGQWSLTIEPLSKAPELRLPYQAEGDKVFRYLSGAAEWSVAHSGESNFAVIQYGDWMPGLLVNEIGAFEGTVPATGGPSLVTVSADGDWSIK